MGRSFTELSSRLCYPELVDDAGKVLRKMVPVEKQVTTRDQASFTVRIMPCRTLETG